jgi:hypothetical protein
LKNVWKKHPGRLAVNLLVGKLGEEVGVAVLSTEVFPGSVATRWDGAIYAV